MYSEFDKFPSKKQKPWDVPPHSHGLNLIINCRGHTPVRSVDLLC